MYNVNAKTIKIEESEFISYGVSFNGGEINDVCLDKYKIETFVNNLK